MTAGAVEGTLNGLDPVRLREILQIVKADAVKAGDLNKRRARIRWLGAFTTRAYVRNHAVQIDEPGDIAGVDTAPNAVEYVLSALGACLTVGFILNATLSGVRVRDFEAAVEGEIDNILVFLGLDDKGHPGYRRVRVKAYVRAEAPKEHLEEIWQRTVAGSPVANTLFRNVELIPEVAVIK
jgi:uncharacterized OsmC-like protein